MGKNKALAHHNSTHFHTRRVSFYLSCFRSPTLAGAPFGYYCVLYLQQISYMLAYYDGGSWDWMNMS